MGDNQFNLDEELIRKRLGEASNEIAANSSPTKLAMRKSGWRIGAILGVGAFLVATASVGFAAGRVTAPEAGGQHSLVTGASTLPAVAQQAVNALPQQLGPDFAGNVTSAETKYVTDAEFWDAVGTAWRHNDAKECNSFSGPTGALGHDYVVILHGHFSLLDSPSGRVVSSSNVEAVLVHASDWHLDLLAASSPQAKPSDTPQAAQALLSPPLGPDGEPLCWSSLVSS